MKRILVIILAAFVCFEVKAQTPGSGAYNIGSPNLNTIYVDPVSGDDDNNGNSRSSALKTVDAAWRKIPQGMTLSTGYKILLMEGTYPESSLPNYLESRYGTSNAPIIFQADTGKTVLFQGDLNIFDTRYLYLLDFSIVPSPAGDTFHCEQCDHILLRNMSFNGGSNREAQETIKINQSQYVYIENSNISGASDNAIDFVAVQYGHILNNKIHNAQDWCVYVKGGSAYMLVEGNRIYNCGTGGFTAGQGTGFEFMSSPWLHYEAYDVKFVNNLVYNTEGAGAGVNGGYNILIAGNTFYRIGSRSHVFEAVFGARSCDGNTSACQSRINAGGWGIASTGSEVYIPNRNVQVIKNIFYNPTGVQSGSQHFAIYGPRNTPGGSNIPSPAKSDTNLSIRGNVIWNGPSGYPLGIEDSGEGCQSGNTTCNATQLASENVINSVEPALLDPANGDFRPVDQGNLFSLASGILSQDPQNFTGGDREPTPQAPEGNLTNSVSMDRGGATRSTGAIPGAYIGANSTLDPTTPPGDGGNGGGGDTTAPTISKLSVSATREGKKISVKIANQASDNVGVSAVTADIATTTNQLLGSATLKAKGNRYSVTKKVKASNKVKKVSVTIMAKDAANNTSSSVKRVKVN